VIDWLAKESSGVILISLRAFPSMTVDQQAEAGLESTHPTQHDSENLRCRKMPSSAGGKTGWQAAFKRAAQSLRGALPALPAPLRAVAEVRKFGARARSKITVEHVRVMLGTRNIPFDFIAFENTNPVNMSWYLKPSEYDCLKKAVSLPQNRQQMD